MASKHISQGMAHTLEIISRLAIICFLVLTALNVQPVLPVKADPAGTALSFNGSSQYVTFGPATSTLGATTFTIEAWFYRTGTGVTTSTSAAGGGGLLSAIPLVTKGRGEGDGGNVDMNYWLGIDNGTNAIAADFEECKPGDPGCPAGGTAGLNHSIVGSTSILNNRWYHVAVTYDGRIWNLYLNGNLERTLDIGATRYPRWDSIQHAAIGSALNSTGVAAGFFTGHIDEVRIWNIARSQADIQANMYTELTSGSGLIGRWGLNDGSGASAANSIVSSPNGTLVNAPTWVNGFQIPPTPPTGLAATSGEAVIHITWDAHTETDVNGYNLYRSTESGVYGSSPLNGTLITGTSYDDYTGVVGTTYYYVLKAVDNLSISSAASSEVSGTPQADTTPPAAPTGLTANPGNTTMSLSWTSPGDPDVAGYNLYRGTTTGVYDPTPINGGMLIATTNYPDSGLGNDTPYFYVVKAVDTSSNESGASNEATGTPFLDTTQPAAPTGLSRTIQLGQIKLDWTAPADSDLNGFNVYRATSTPVTLTGPLNGGTPLSKTTATFTDSTTAPDTTYYYVVTAVDASTNQSGASNEVNGRLNAALQFDGTNDYVSFGSTAGLGVTSFTLEAWIKRSAAGTTVSTGNGGVVGVPIISKGRCENDGSNVDANYFLGLNSSNQLVADFEDKNNGLNHPITGIGSIPTDSTWHHVSVTYDQPSGIWKLYIDGNLDNSLTVSGVDLVRTPRNDSIQHAAIGTALDSAGSPTGTCATNAGYFAGSIDEARIWNFARSQFEIRETINQELTSGTGLIARWGLNEGKGSPVASSVGSFPGTLTGGPTWFMPGSPFNIAPPTPPTAPTLLSATPTVGLQINLAWTDNSDNETSFKIERSPDGSSGWAQINASAANAVSYSDSGLTSATQYCYRVKASNSTGDSPYSNTSCATTPGEYNNALKFGNSSAYAKFEPASSLNSSTFTVETWFRRDGTGVEVTTGSGGITTAIPLVTKGTSEAETADADINYFLFINNVGGKLCADFEEAQSGASPSLNHPVCGATTIVNGTWYHGAATYDGTTWKIYLNGNLDGTLTVSRPANAANIGPLCMGSSCTSIGSPQGYFDGALDEVRVWNYARSQTDIQGTMNSAITDPQIGLVGRWGLNEASGTAVASNAGTTVNGTINGSGWSWNAGTSAIVNHAPQIVSASPLDTVVDVPTPAVLSIEARDADLDNLTVRFYGRPKAGNFTIIALPDTQNLSATSTYPTYSAVYNSQTQWIADNQLDRNISFVTHLGDIVNDGAIAAQWTRAVTAMNIIDAAGIPYGFAVGNHDQNPYQTPGSTAEFNANFGLARFSGKPYYGGHFGTKNDNSYQLFSGGGMDFIIFHLENNNSQDLAVLTWMDGLLQTYSSRRAIIVTHNLLQGTTLSTQASAIWDAIKARPNVFLMLGGHLTTAGRTFQSGTNGNRVDFLRSDYQDANDGYLRIMNFRPRSNEIFVETYSPWTLGALTDGENQFTLTYPMTGSDYVQVGTDQTILYGNGTANVSWEGLDPAKEYEWYAVVTDDVENATLTARSFTTGSTGNNAPVITESDPRAVTMSEDGSPTPFTLTLHATDADVSDTLNWSVSTPASHGAASASGTGQSMAIGYTPNVNYNGTDSFVVQVADGNGGIDTVTVNVTIQPVNDPPVCSDVVLTTSENTAGDTAPSCIDVDTGDTLTYSIVANAVNGTASVVAGNLHYIPNTNYNGSDGFTYRTFDGTVYGNTANVAVTVTAVNDPPIVTNPGTQTNAEGSVISLQITASDVDSPTLTYSATNLPLGLSINTSTGLISGAITYHAGAHSPYSSSVTVNDGTTPVPVNFTWNVPQAASGLCGSDPTLVGCWQMEEGSGLDLIDSSAVGNDATITGGPTWVAGKPGQALKLNGTSQYATVPDNNSLDMTTAITMAAWVKPEKIGTTQNIIKKTIGTTTANGYELSLGSGGKVFVRLNGNATYRIDSSTSYPTTGTEWMHVAATYDGTNIKLYIDGVLEGTKPGVTIGTNATNLGIGAEPASTVINFYQGTMDDVRIYNRALSLSEIQTLAGVATTATLTINKTGTGTGTVTSIPAGINCGADCSEDYAVSTEVTLTATADAPSTFTGWSGAGCTGTGNCVVTMDAAKAVTASFTQNVHSISLVSGWNLVSFNLHPTNSSIANVLAPVAGQYDIVYAWDASGGHSGSGNWQKYDPAMGFGNTLDTLDEARGFWIHMTSVGTLNVYGSRPTSTTVNMTTTAGGWNLVGYPAAGNHAMPEAFSTHGIGSDFSIVYANHANDSGDPWKMYDAGGPAYANDLIVLAPGWGYWVFVSASHPWDVSYIP